MIILFRAGCAAKSGAFGHGRVLSAAVVPANLMNRRRLRFPRVFLSDFLFRSDIKYPPFAATNVGIHITNLEVECQSLWQGPLSYSLPRCRSPPLLSESFCLWVFLDKALIEGIQQTISLSKEKPHGSGQF